jgi:SNF2 family DNA or RNA helicase
MVAMKNQRKFVMKSTLKPFQKATLKWMEKREQNEGGGMLLNSAGTGKSINSLNLIVNKPVNTLIVCPAGIIDNWCNEIEKHTNIDSLLVLKYYGPERQNYTINIGKQVVYITSYSIIAREFTGKKFESESLINKVKFERIILDEAHYIRNHRSNNFETVMKISEVQDTIRYRWIVTATPIFNKINDAYAYFNFLGLEGIDDRGQWTTRISKDINGIKIVNEWFKKHAITFKKEEVLKEELSNKNETKIILKFSEPEQEFYNALKEYSLVRMKTLMKRIKNLHKTLIDDKETMKKLLRSNVMVYILRLKQCCDSPMLILESMKRLKNVNTIENAIETLKFFNESKNQEEECPICYDTVANYIAKPCGHKCCGDCWDRMSNLNITNCPKCRSEIREIININETETDSENETKITYIESTKIDYLLDLTNKIVKKGEKIIIVSQWVSMLNIIRNAFNEANIKFISLQGDIQIKERSKYIKQFETDTKTKVCFISLMSSAEGINLVAANHLVLVDSWWNESKMIQVADRIHRIGQKRQVNIYNLQVENTIEQQIEKLVKKKSKITKLVLNKWNIDTSNYDGKWITDIVKLLDKPPLEPVN